VLARCRAHGLVIDGVVEDVSRWGMFLRAPELVATGSSAEIELDLRGEAPLQLSAEVVRLERSPGRAGMGLRILVDPADRRLLVNFIMRKHAEATVSRKVS